MDAPRSKLLLLVDDEARSARILAKMLREDGFDVEVAFDGGSAISRLGRHPVPDALLTDFRLPVVDGATVAKFARSIDARMPIFFITGYPNMAAQRSAALGASIHPKPLDYPALSQDVRHQLAELMRRQVACVLHHLDVTQGPERGE